MGWRAVHTYGEPLGSSGTSAIESFSVPPEIRLVLTLIPKRAQQSECHTTATPAIASATAHARQARVARLVCPGNFVPADKLEKLGQEGPGNGKKEVYGR